MRLEASASVREDRPHREPVPARQETPCHLTCSIGRDPSMVVVVRRSDAGAQAQNAKKQRRARQRNRSDWQRHATAAPDDLLFDASWPSRPGRDGIQASAAGTAKPPRRPRPRASASNRCIRSSAHLPSPYPAVDPRMLRADDRTPTASPFTRAQPAALQYASAIPAILPPSLTFLACSLDRRRRGPLMTKGPSATLE